MPTFVNMKLLMYKRKVMIRPSEVYHWGEQIRCTLNELQSFKYYTNMYEYHL